MSITRDKLQSKLDIYSSYISVLKNVFELLQEGNNSYTQTYLDTLDDFLEKEERHNKRDVVVFILMTIYNERNKCRLHTNDHIAKTFETNIIQEGLKILWYDCNIQHILDTMNQLLTFKFEPIHFIEYKNTFGCDIVIDYDEFENIDKDNITQVYERFNRYVRLNNIRIKNNNYFGGYIFNRAFLLFDDIDSYLFCLYYYKN